TLGAHPGGCKGGMCSKVRRAACAKTWRILFRIGHKLVPPWRNLMRTGSGHVGDPSAAGREADQAATSPFATPRWVAWHGGLAAWLDRLRWAPTPERLLSPARG